MNLMKVTFLKNDKNDNNSNTSGYYLLSTN